MQPYKFFMLPNYKKFRLLEVFQGGSGVHSELDFVFFAECIWDVHNEAVIGERRRSTILLHYSLRLQVNKRYLIENNMIHKR